VRQVAAAVTDETDPQAGQPAKGLADGLQIGEDLARVAAANSSSRSWPKVRQATAATCLLSTRAVSPIDSPRD